MYNYLCLDTGLVNPLIWWRDNEKYFPRLSQLARCVPATSVPSEHAFSAAAHVVNKKRSSLLPENVNMLVFLSANLRTSRQKNLQVNYSMIASSLTFYDYIYRVMCYVK